MMFSANRHFTLTDWHWLRLRLSLNDAQLCLIELIAECDVWIIKGLNIDSWLNMSQRLSQTTLLDEVSRWDRQTCQQRLDDILPQLIVSFKNFKYLIILSVWLWIAYVISDKEPILAIGRVVSQSKTLRKPGQTKPKWAYNVISINILNFLDLAHSNLCKHLQYEPDSTNWRSWRHLSRQDIPDTNL